MIEAKNFVLGLSDISAYTSNLHINSLRALRSVYQTSQFQMQVFKQQSATKVNGVMIYFSGGEGFEVMDSSNLRVAYTAKNYIFINFTSLPDDTSVMGVPFLNQSPSHGSLKFQAREVDVALDYVFSTVIADPSFAGIFDASTPVYLFGHSRGAGVVAAWAEQQNGLQQTTVHSPKVKAIGCNSPAAGSGSGGKYAYDAIRASYGAAQKAGVRTLVTTGADDRTHLSRAEAERIHRALDANPLVEFRVVGGVGDGHRPFEGKYDQWFDAVIEFGNA